MIDDGNEKRNRQLAFELQNSHVCEKRSKSKKNGKTAFRIITDKQKLVLFGSEYLAS